MSVTVVTCYYKIKSKHSHDEYDKWITKFLSNISCNLVIFTSPDLVDYIVEKRQRFLDKTRIISIEFEELPVYKLYKELWEVQYQMDNQKDSGRTKECYVLWNSKIYFLREAMEISPFCSDKFIWCDIGCLRTQGYDSSLINQIINNYPLYEKISKNQIDIVLLEPIQNTEQKIFIGERHFSGSMFGGHKDVILVFYELFYKKLYEHIQQGVFIGCDQQTISSVYNDNRGLFNCISTNNHPNDDYNWFYLWEYYSQP